MKYGLIGRKLSHSFSPEIHGKIGDYKYELFSLEEEQLEPFMKKRDFSGINVTIPYKSAVIPYLDFVDEEAELIGAVNTVVKRDGLLYGYNTDVTGLTMLITRVCGSTLCGKALVLGTGGTSLTAVYALKKLGLKEIYRVSREVKDGCITYEDALKYHSDAQYVINTTPCGMYPNVYDTPIDISAFTSLKGVVDAIFNPLSTPLVRKAKGMGVASEGGLFMLVSQAVAAYCHFFDKEVEFGICSKIYEEILKEKQNIVLVGMPSSGKSSIGKELSVITGKPFYDSDEVIKEKAGMTIPEIFEKYGENYFRTYESDVIFELSKKSGVIIATGGGAVLKSENVDALKANGVIVFLDRHLDMLVPTSDRPLSSDIEMLKKRYNERYPIYTAVSDMTVPSVSDVKTVAKMVEEEWKK